MNRLSVLFLVRSLEVGGAERQLVQLCRGLAARGHRIGVAVFYRGGPWEKALAAANVEMVYLDKRGKWDIAGFALRLRRAVRAFDPDIVHSYLSVPNLVAIAMKPLMGRARVVAGVRASRFDLGGYDRATRIAFALERAALPAADLVIVNSSAAKASLNPQGAFARRIRVIHNGIDTESFRPDASERAQTRGRWEIDAGSKVVGLVARYDPLKDHRTFLEAAAIVLAKRPATRFAIIGANAPAGRSALEARVQALGLEAAMTWDEGSDSMPLIYNALDVLVSSSISEGFSNVIAEAMACGVPCAVTNVGDSAAIVGDTGKVVAPRDPRALSDAIVALLDGPAGPSPRGRIVERFGLEALVDATERELAQLTPR